MRLDILAGTGPTTLTKTWFVDEIASDVGDLNVAVTGPNGDVVHTAAASLNDTTYSFELPLAASALPSTLRVDWTRADTGARLTDWVEVGGNVLFTVGDARNRQLIGAQRALLDEAAYPAQWIADARLLIADRFEQRTARSWTARYCRLVAPGHCGKLIAPFMQSVLATGEKAGGPAAGTDLIRVLAWSIHNEPQDPDALVIDGPVLRHRHGGFSGPVVIEGVYGADPVPWEAHDNALEMLLTNIPDKVSAFATSANSEDGTFRITTWPKKVEDFLRTHKPVLMG